MKWLITGIEGFAGKHMLDLLKKEGKTVFGTTIDKKLVDNKNIFYLDIAYDGQIKNIIEKIKPDYLVLLAGLSSLRDSFANPDKYFKINFRSTKIFVEAIYKLKLKTKVLVISSAMVYCPSLKLLKETDPVSSESSPYASTKLMQENLIDEYPDVDIIVSRSFNHVGIGQNEEFLLPRLTKQFAFERSNTVVLNLGDLNSIRDYTDVRDTCNAYKLLLEKGKSRNIYNVCSSKEWSIKQIIEMLEKHSGKKAIIKENPKMKKRNELKYLVGNNSKIKKDTSWVPKVDLKTTIAEMYDYWVS